MLLGQMDIQVEMWVSYLIAYTKIHVKCVTRKKNKLLGLKMENIYIKWAKDLLKVQTVVEEIDELD